MADKPTSTPAVIGAAPPPHPFVPDPGEVFATDAHRRVLGHLPTPRDQKAADEVGSDVHNYTRIRRSVSISQEGLLQRLNEDSGLPNLDPADVERIVGELEAAGHVSTQNGLRMTEAGHDAIQGGADV
jgi:hypothetical protein